jgi:hypothetical protein
VLHIRLHQPFLQNWRQLAASRLESWGLPCIENWRPERVLRLTPPEQLAWSVTDSARRDVIATHAKADSISAKSWYSPQLAIGIEPPDLETLRHSYDQAAEQRDILTFGRRMTPMPLSESERLMAARVWDRQPLSASTSYPPKKR